MPKPRKSVKAAADRSGRRSKGAPVDGHKVEIDPEITAEVAGYPPRHGAGRPTDYRIEYCKTAFELCQDGATDIEVADAIGIHEVTLYRWKARHPEFRKALELGKDAADNRVERSMYRRAVGYSYDSVKVFQFEGVPVVVPVREHVPPDVSAQRHWLANRKPDAWREKQEVQHSADNAFVALLKAMGGDKAA